MPAILPALLSAARHLVLALAGLGLVATSMSALPASAATTSNDRSTDRTRGHATMVHSPGSGQRVRVAVPWTSQWFGGTLRR